MILNFFITTDSDNVINKKLNSKHSENIRLKRDFDLISPKITMRESDGVVFDNYNYAQIPELNRYYFIKNIERINNSIVIIHLHCDVLSTYSEHFLNTPCIFNSEVVEGDKGYISNFNNSEFKFNDYESDVEFETSDYSLILTTIKVE